LGFNRDGSFVYNAIPSGDATKKESGKWEIKNWNGRVDLVVHYDGGKYILPMPRYNKQQDFDAGIALISPFSVLSKKLRYFSLYKGLDPTIGPVTLKTPPEPLTH